MARALLPELIEGSAGVRLRRWRPDDVEILDRLVRESADHLRPWSPWIAEEPLPLARRGDLVARWETDWRLGGDVYLGIFLDGQPAGSCGLHRRIGPSGLEIGYWVHPAFLRRGLASETARLLTGAALEVPGIDHVEIHHDEANERSAGIPRQLGFSLVGRKRDDPPDPAGTGIALIWRMTRSDWTGADA